METTRQLDAWTGQFGKDFTARFDLPLEQADARATAEIGRSLTDSFKSLLGDLPIKTVLEVGCNVGQKLAILSNVGSYQLFGVEPQTEALKTARTRRPDINFIEGNVFNLPFRDGFFDVVYTSVVLIHISPTDLPRALAEIHRVAKRYIVGMEYHSNQLEEVDYRGEKGLLWKQDFEEAYKKQFPELKTVKSQTFEYSESVYGRRGLYDKHFILSK